MNESFTSLCGIRYPIVQAGMAGGPATPELAAAVSNAGGLGTLGAGYMAPNDVKAAIKSIKEMTAKPFAVNLFLPEEFTFDRDQTEKMEATLEGFKERLGMEKSSRFTGWTSHFQDQLDVVMEEKVPVISFTFNAPTKEIIDRLKQEGVVTIATATTVEEAVRLEAVGIDAISAQGSEAGGHRGTFLGSEEQALIGSMTLIPLIADAVSIPVLAAGGIMDARGMAAALALGASAVQLGTAFLTAEESGAHHLHKEAVLESKETDMRLTKAFSGKMARGITNIFMEEMTAVDNLPPYPIQNALTSGLRKAAASRGEKGYMSLWAGQGAPLAKRRPAKQVVESLIEDYNRIADGLVKL
ncbi:NAD(P)H-dependent flavin oxidoreductase [Fictibacillus enclensis]|uniref:NAD(P)H-dependent flavin oxidoreductase n=1 Tax=Fictibacillus enclensis TaxID=1017270 RepID=UPI0024BFE6DE|nr:nitronate monooxygenase [Fictibacillus enclensis]WHY74077.1 nitronate monooxygenase [Fictibacillus enclensis]